MCFYLLVFQDYSLWGKGTPDGTFTSFNLCRFLFYCNLRDNRIKVSLLFRWVMNYIGLFIYINTGTSKFSEICVALYIAEACTRETVLTQICVVFIYFCQLPELWSRSSALGCATYIVKTHGDIWAGRKSGFKCGWTTEYIFVRSQYFAILEACFESCYLQIGGEQESGHGFQLSIAETIREICRFRIVGE